MLSRRKTETVIQYMLPTTLPVERKSLAAWIETLGLKPYQVADLSGVARGTLYNWLEGLYEPQKKQERKVLAFLESRGIPKDAIIFPKEEKE